MPEFTNNRLTLYLSLLLFALTTVGLVDLVQDDVQDWKNIHVLFDLLFIILSLGSALFLWLGWQTANSTLSRTRKALEAHQLERDAWRQKAQGYLVGLGETIALQLKLWGLTPAESETALFLLKGFSHKEIASLTGKSKRDRLLHFDFNFEGRNLFINGGTGNL